MGSMDRTMERAHTAPCTAHTETETVSRTHNTSTLRVNTHHIVTVLHPDDVTATVHPPPHTPNVTCLHRSHVRTLIRPVANHI